MEKRPVYLFSVLCVVVLLGGGVLGGPIGGMLDTLGKLAQQGAQASKDVAGQAGEGIKKFGEEIGHKAQEVYHKAGDGVGSAADTVKNTFNGAVGGVKKGKEDLESLLGKVNGIDFSKFTDFFKSFSSGSGKTNQPPQKEGPQPTTTPSTTPTGTGGSTPQPTPTNPTKRPLPPPPADPFTAMAGSLGPSIASKLADERVRSALMSGFLSEGKFLRDTPACRSAQDNWGGLFTVMGEMAMPAGTNILARLNSMVKADRLVREMFGPDGVQCMTDNTQGVQKVLLKLVYFNEEMLESAKSDFELLGTLAGVALQLQMGAYTEAGESLARAVKAAAHLRVGVDEEMLGRVDMKKCLLSVAKARSRQTLEYDSPVLSWKIALAEARASCLSA